MFASTATAQISELTELSESKTYTISNARGGIATEGSSSTSCTKSASISTSDVNHQWVFIKSTIYTETPSYYLYNVGAGKFMSYSGNSVTLTDASNLSLNNCFKVEKAALTESNITANFKISSATSPSWFLAFSNSLSAGMGFTNSSSYNDYGARVNFTEASTSYTNETAKNAVTTLENNLNTALTSTIAAIKTAVGENAGKIGYPTTEAYTTFTNAVEATGATYLTKNSAVSTVLAKANMTLPTDGKAYYIHPVNKDASNKTTYYLYTNTSGKLHFTTTKGSNTIFYAHKVGEKFIFTNNAGKYITFRADGQTAADQSNGVLDEYNSVCQFAILPFYFSGTGESTSNSNVTSATTEYLGLTMLQGYIVCPTSTAQTGDHYLMLNTSQTTIDNPFHNGAKADIYYTTNGNTCAYYFEEADQENAFKATEMKVGEETMYLGSYSSPFPVVLPEGLTAYKVSQAGETATLSPIDGQVIPASTGVIIKAENTTEVIPVARTTEDIPTVDDNKLKASTGSDIESSVNAFILGCDATTKAANFYKLSSTNRIIKLYKAYLDLTASSSNKLTLNFGGVISGINSANISEPAKAQSVYDLSGRRVSKPAHGFYIVNGKKTLVK